MREMGTQAQEKLREKVLLRLQKHLGLLRAEGMHSYPFLPPFKQNGFML